MIRNVVSMWPTALVGIIVGLLATLLTHVGVGAAWTEYDRTHPVSTATAHIVSRLGDSADIELVATRHRDCIYRRVSALAVMPDNTTEIIFMQRLGVPAGNVSHAPGTTHRSKWRVWPVDHAIAVRVLATYDCDGRELTHALVEVPLS